VNNVTNLAEVREARIPHMNGTARCLHCGHEHKARVPEGVVTDLDCPECGLPKAVMVGLCAPADGVPRWACTCGCQLFHLLESGIQCLHCGKASAFPW